MGNPRRQKQEMERARRQRAAAKRQRRLDRASPGEDTDVETDAGPEDEIPVDHRSQDEVMAALAALHERYGEGGMSLEDFEGERDELMRLIHVD